MGLGDKTISALSAISSKRTMIDRYVPAVIAAVLGGVFLWGRMIPIDVLHSEVTSTVQRGGWIEVQRHLKWYRWDCWSYEASTTFIDSLRYSHMVEVKHYGLPSLDDFTDHEWQVPFVMPYGPTKISTDLAMSCFPFFTAWPVKVELPDLTFEVVPEH